MRATPRARHPRPHAQRKPKGVTLPRHAPGGRPLGGMVEIDTMHLHPAPGVTRYQFPAVDCASRWGVLGVRATATAGTAKEFLGEVRNRMPFPIKAIQIDGGSEWMAAFEQACQEARLPLWIFPPHSPKLHGQVARVDRTHREAGALWAVWECSDGDLALPTVGSGLREEEGVYNNERPHHALGLRTPAAFLADCHLSKRERARTSDVLPHE